LVHFHVLHLICFKFGGVRPLSKGYDRITTAIVLKQNEFFFNKEPIDEIKQYLDYRYVSPCEAC